MNAGAQWAGSPRGHEGEAGMLHADLDCFFASVAQRDDPRLRGRPVAVGGGVILAASYEARRAGVRSAMSGREARARCPDLVLVPTDFDAYTRASRQVMALFRETTPVVRVMSIDEAFLDVRGLRHLEQSPLHVARRLRARVSAQVGLTVSVGVARTPFLAKMASTASKPNGLLLIPPEGRTPSSIRCRWHGCGVSVMPRQRAWPGVGCTPRGTSHNSPVRCSSGCSDPAPEHGCTPSCTPWARSVCTRRTAPLNADRSAHSVPSGEDRTRPRPCERTCWRWWTGPPAACAART